MKAAIKRTGALLGKLAVAVNSHEKRLSVVQTASVIGLGVGVEFRWWGLVTSSSVAIGLIVTAVLLSHLGGGGKA